MPSPSASHKDVPRESVAARPSNPGIPTPGTTAPVLPKSDLGTSAQTASRCDGGDHPGRSFSKKRVVHVYDKSDVGTSHIRSNREFWGQTPNLKLSRRDNSVTVPRTPKGSIAALGALSSSATSKWWIRARIEDVAVDKKVGQLCRENGEFWIAVEC